MNGNGSSRERIYRYILAYQQTNHYAPSMREICRALGIKSTSTVHWHIKRMTRDGLLMQATGCPRAIWANPECCCSK